jgi:hypothetical protein
VFERCPVKGRLRMVEGHAGFGASRVGEAAEVAAEMVAWFRSWPRLVSGLPGLVEECPLVSGRLVPNHLLASFHGQWHPLAEAKSPASRP